jgi:HPt (histidine-containing phosphotransfer) domain-containing protein
MTDVGEGLETLLAAARADFLTRLEPKVGELEELSARGAWAEVRRAAHRLRGSAATYGFASVGVAAAAMEDLLIEVDSSPGDEAKKRFASLLGTARTEVERLVKEGA